MPNNWDEVPETFREAFEAEREQFASSGIGSYFVDAFEARQAITISFFTAIILCMAYTMLMSFVAEILAWIVITLTWVGLIVTAVGFWIIR